MRVTSRAGRRAQRGPRLLRTLKLHQNLGTAAGSDRGLTVDTFNAIFALLEEANTDVGESRDGKLQRISDEAHKAAKIAAAIEESTMEEWCSKVLLEQARRVRYENAPRAMMAPRAPAKRR